MPDTKITALTAISTVDPAADPLVIVDVSDTSMAASGTTKKITSNQILGAGGTATLASATISGDLTVDTSTLKVDSANNRVGIGTASPQQNLHVFGTGTQTIAVERDGATIAGRFEFVSGNSTNLVRCVTAKDLVFEQATGTEVYRIAANGVATWSNVGGVAGTAMTLNSTGLGVGVTSPAAKFDSLVADAAESARFRAASGWLRIHPYLDATDVCRLQSVNNTNTGLQNLTIEGFNLRFNTNNGNAVIIDNLGNTVSNVNSAVPALGTNNRMVFNLTSNTNLRISVRGSDGVTRVANITLA